MKIKLGISTGINVGNLGVRKASGGAAPALPSYSSILINTYGASEVWPLVDIASGTTITAKVNAARNGVLTGWDLRNTAGPVTNTLAPYLDGVNAGAGSDKGNIGAISTIWDWSVGSIGILGKVSGVADWSDGVTRTLVSIIAGTNHVKIFKHPTLGIRIQLSLGIVKLVTASTTTTDWFMAVITWKNNDNGNEMKGYFNGSQVGTTQTGAGSGSGAVTTALLGDISGTGTEDWKGWMAYAFCKPGAVWSAADISNMYNALAGAGPENP